MGIREGKAYSAMCAYNRFQGEACCGSNRLLIEILRNEWGFNGYVVSDCGAINDIYENHKIVESPEEAAALAVKSGCDLECGQVYESLKKAVSKGLITEQEIDVAVKRLFTARFKLGMFDPPEMVKYAQIPYEVLDSRKHRDLALKVARASIVLLKNENNLLPLDKNIKTIAVIGPNADHWQVLLGNYNGTPADPVTPLRGIKEKVSPATKVLYAQGCDLTAGIPVFSVIPSDVLFSEGKAGSLKGEYYNNRDLSNPALFSRIDQNIDFKWFEQAPRPDLDADNFSVRWSGELRPDRPGQYKLGLISSCKVRLYLDDQLLARSTYRFRDEYGDPRLRESQLLQLEAGRSYALRVEAEESYGDARVQLLWTRPETGLSRQAVEAARQADMVVMCMGLSPRLEGEEMPINIEGFRGGDRTSLDLPQVQQDLIRQVQGAGKPIVLVLLNGSAVAVNWENENIPAIVETWYGGQAAGQALADVLFGDYNPAGRLPVTFYKSVEDLPPFEDYAMNGRTYRYFKGEPLYPFGYGLSYTTFNYANLKSKKPAAGKRDSFSFG